MRAGLIIDGNSPQKFLFFFFFLRRLVGGDGGEGDGRVADGSRSWH